MRSTIDYSLTLETVNGISYYTSKPLLEKQGILVVFTTRQGGTGSEPYYSMNLALHVGDDPKTVIENRKAVCLSFNLDPARLTCAEQVHSNGVAVITDSNIGAGAFSFDDSIKGVDALVSDCGLVPAMLFFADCVPVVLVEPQKRAVGVIHAGWRGIYSNVIGNAIETMSRSLSVTTDKVIAFIGPSIGACCYQAGIDLVEKFRAQFKSDRSWLSGDRVDLRALCKKQLIDSGIGASSIYLGNDCTSCQRETFFSYRAEGGKTGRQAALAAIL